MPKEILNPLKDAKRIRYRGITFERRDGAGHDRDGNRCEVWEVVLPPDIGLPYFCVKNYGGEPRDDDAFSGWRIVSGGPYTEAGGWRSRDEALTAAAPWLREYYRRRAMDLAAEAATRVDRLREYLGGLSK